ncbi:hypothetical protein Ancab_036732 [Ancistrocladus abbreviatus]
MAKPKIDKKSEATAAFNSGPNYFPPSAYGFAGKPYGTLGAGLLAMGLLQDTSSGMLFVSYCEILPPKQPAIYGRGPMPAGMQMGLMVLPDGRIDSVFQQPGAQMPSM